MASRRKGLAIFIGFMVVLASGYPLSLVATWLGFVPISAFALGMAVLALWAARSAASAATDLRPLSLFRATMQLIAMWSLAMSIAAAAIGVLYRLAPRAPSGPRTHALDVQSGIFYVTPGEATAFLTLEVVIAVTFAAAFLLGILWNYRNGGAAQRPR